MPDRKTIQDFMRTALADIPFIAVSNREPYIHSYTPNGEVACSRATSGVVTALDPVLQASCGTWIAHGSGNADFAAGDGRGSVAVSPERPAYMLKRIRLTQAQEDGYYSGFANQGLWPLCHMAHQQPVFDSRHWHTYQEVNSIFADEVCRTLSAGGGEGLVFVQDYHFALLPKMIKQRCPQATVAHFWHIPWPNPEFLNICPWKREILDGMLSADLLGFHLQQYCDNFMDAALSTFSRLKTHGANTLTMDEKGSLACGHTTTIRPFPVSIDFEAVDHLAKSREVARKVSELRATYRLPPLVGVGIDRLDYIKGIPERIQALGRFFEMYPEFRGNFSFVQLAVPSRTELAEYRELSQTIGKLVDDLNGRFGTPDWKPVILIRDNLPPADVTALYRAADFCLVTSLHDGMNLVAKEFVAARTDETGVLLLSRFAGASNALNRALLLNPYDAEQVAALMRKALTMNSAEAAARMRRLRLHVRTHDAFRWMLDILAAASECRRKNAPEPLTAEYSAPPAVFPGAGTAAYPQYGMYAKPV